MLEESKENFVNIKSLIVNGKDHTEPVETEIGVFRIRPLDLGEKSLIEAKSLSGLRTSAKASISGKMGENVDTHVIADIEKIQLAEDEAKFMVLAWGLSVKEGPKYEPADIRNMVAPKEVIDKVYNRICEISGLDLDSLAPFRKYLTGLGSGGGGAVGTPANPPIK